MAKSKASKGFGTVIQIGNGASPEVFATIEETNMGEFDPTGDPAQIDVTHSESPGGIKEYINGLIETGEVPLDGNWTNDPNQILLRTAAGGDAVNFRVQFPQPTLGLQFAFSANVRGFKIQPNSPAGSVKFTCSLKISGLVTESTLP